MSQLSIQISNANVLYDLVHVLFPAIVGFEILRKKGVWRERFSPKSKHVEAIEENTSERARRFHHRFDRLCQELGFLQNDAQGCFMMLHHCRSKHLEEYDSVEVIVWICPYV
jgi:hypothetical protein